MRIMDDRHHRAHARAGVGGPHLDPRLGRRVAVLSVVLASLPLAARAQDQSPRDRVHTVDHSIEAYVSDKAMQAQYERELQIEGFGPLEARAGVFYNEQRDMILVGDALTYIGDQAPRRVINVSVGTRLYGAFLAQENQDAFGVGLGGEAEYFFAKDKRASLKLSAFYSPDILTFGLSDDVRDVTVRLQTRIREATDIFVGYRKFTIDMPTGDRQVDDHLHIGFKRSF
jgi:hypothetical protein